MWYVFVDPEGILLDWNKRKTIILAVARDLLYLHQQDVIHGNVTPGIILLDESFDPKLSDFGLVRSLLVDEINCVDVNPIRETL